jgi:phosphohistidine phosphatase SixA
MALFDWLRRLFTGIPVARTGEVVAGESPFSPGSGPSRLVILRHAEKTGEKSDPHLSLPGRKRAERLVAYIPATFGRPDFLIAARTSNRSRRPVETLEPLAAALSLEIDAKLDDSDVDELIEVLRDKKRYQGKVGVISWRHSDMPELAHKLGEGSNVVPEHWDAADYTSIVDITFPGDGTVQARRLQMPF